MTHQELFGIPELFKFTTILFLVTATGLLYAAISPMPCISYDKPTYVSSTLTGDASMTNAFSDEEMWRSEGQPAWVAYDLSSVPAAERTTIIQ